MVDYFFMRNVVLFCVTWLFVFIMKIDIFDLPKDKTKTHLFVCILIRSLCGHVNFYLFNMAFLFAPVALVSIVFQTYPFFASIYGIFINGEYVTRFEVGGMILCFGGISLLGLTSMN